MSLQTFFDNFALLADAPNGVAKLRELILQLAIQGKLDTQNPNDELASELFRKIQLHKARLIKDKLIRNSKPLPAIQSSEILSHIPQSWQWIRLGEIGDWGAGATPDRKNHKYYGGKIRWFKSGELNDGYIRESEEKITDLALKECSLRLNQSGDVLIAMYGATIGKLAILETEATTNQAVCACTCFAGFDNQFLFVLLRAYKSHFTARGAGGAQPNISREKIIHTVAPLPPLEEQKRIVAKVAELMRLCDELEARQLARRGSRVRLNNATLAPLNNAASLAPEEFEQASARLVDNFAALYDSAETISHLRSTILQIAVQGKLVPQDPHDESASVLLEKILGINAKLFSQPEDVPFSLPDNWLWVRFGDVFDIQGGTQPPKSQFITSPSAGYVRLLQIRDFGSKPEPVYVRRDSVRSICTTRDVMLARYGASVGKVFMGQEGAYNVALTKIIFNHEYLYNRFVFFLLKSSLFQDTLRPMSRSAQAGFNKGDIHPISLPLPPLEEQKRIVAKVNQFMALCDEVETKLRQTEADSGKLMKAAVRNLLASVAGNEKGQRETALALSSI